MKLFLFAVASFVIIPGVFPRLASPTPRDGCPAYPENIFFNLTKDFFLQKVNNSMALSYIMNGDGNLEEERKKYQQFDLFEDCNDRALVAKSYDNICFGAFSATGSDSFLWYAMNQWQNINPFRKYIGNSDCVARYGYIGGYAASYVEDFRESIDSCINSCDGGCELIMTGISQGAAAAIVAAVDLAQYQPELITFAAPVAIAESSACTVGENLNHYRFVSSSFDAYDNVPNQPRIYGQRHLGNVILLDDGLNFPLSMPSESNMRRLPGNSDLHKSDAYNDRIVAMANRDCFPVPVARWPEGHYCRYDGECDVGSSCVDESCRKGSARE